MSYEHHGQRLRVFVGDVQCSDDPRGREASVHFEFGLPVGEFDAERYVYQSKKVATIGSGTTTVRHPVRNPDFKEYGTWGFSVTLWRWGLSVGVRGPVLGKWPKEDDE